MITTSEVRGQWTDGVEREPFTHDLWGGLFDLWLNEIKARTWDEAYYHVTNGKWGAPDENPYRQER